MALPDDEGSHGLGGRLREVQGTARVLLSGQEQPRQVRVTTDGGAAKPRSFTR